MMTTTRNKRKGTDCTTSTISSYSVSASYSEHSWMETRQKLKDLRNFSVDDLLSSLDACLATQLSLQCHQNDLLKSSHTIKSQLKSRIELDREACKEESDDLYRMQLRLDQLKADKLALVQALEELDNMETSTRENILQAQEVASQELESIDQVEAERMREVPRLKKQISLYATTTGIKWDFDQDHVLAGQVAVKAKGGIRRFCLDPNEYSDFEIANHLWSLMETGTYAASK